MPFELRSIDHVEALNNLNWTDGGWQMLVWPVKQTNTKLYSKAPKSVTTFTLFTFFRADSIQLEVNCKLSTAFDWIKSARKNVNKLKVVALLGALL